MTLFETKAKTYIPRLMNDLQITRIQACGIFGNLGTETGGFVHLQELKPVVKGSKGGYGWMQWTGPRRRKYEAYCLDKNLQPAVDESNYSYLVHETLTDELHSLVQLRKTTTVEAAAETFMSQNLRPGIPNLESRIKYAHIADDTTKAPMAETSTAIAVGTAGAIATSQSDPALWPWIIGGTIVAIFAGWYLISKLKEAKKEDQVVTLPKKGKK